MSGEEQSGECLWASSLAWACSLAVHQACNNSLTATGSDTLRGSGCGSVVWVEAQLWLTVGLLCAATSWGPSNSWRGMNPLFTVDP